MIIPSCYIVHIFFEIRNNFPRSLFIGFFCIFGGKSLFHFLPSGSTKRTRVRILCCGVKSLGTLFHSTLLDCVRACVCVRVRACVRVCVSYLNSLLTLIRKPTQHRLSGSVLHFTPIVNKNIGNRCFFCVCITLWNIGL